MSNSKISALTSATTPLAGTEVLPIVQSGATKQVAVNDLTVRNVRANATTGILQITGPAVGSTRVATVPNSNWTAARTDNSQTFLDTNTFASVTTTRNATTRPVVVDGGTAVPNPYQNFGIGVKYTGRDYGDAARDYAYIDAVMSAQSSSSGGGDAGFKSKLVFSTNAGGSSGAVPTNQIEINSDGNIVILNSGKGIDFSVVTHSGSTSKLLNDYEEGTWTPTVTSASGTITSYTLTGANYTKTGRTVNVNVVLTITNAGTGAGALQITLPFTNGAVTACGVGRENALTGYELQASVLATSATMSVFTYANLTPIGTNAQIRLSLAYFV